MASQLFRLVMNATTSNRVTAPTIKRYFHKVVATNISSNTYVIPNSLFYNDNNALMGTANLTTATPSNGYYLLYVNGELQQSSLYTVAGDGSNVRISQATDIPNSSPITLTVTNFAPNLSITVTS